VVHIGTSVLAQSPLILWCRRSDTAAEFAPGDLLRLLLQESGAVPAFRLKQQYSQAPAQQSSPATAITALTAGVSPAASLTPLDKDAPCGGVGLSTKPSPDGVAGAGLDAPDVNPTKRGRLSDDGGDSEHESLPNIDPFAALDPLSLWGDIEPGDSADAPIELF